MPRLAGRKRRAEAEDAEGDDISESGPTSPVPQRRRLSPSPISDTISEHAAETVTQNDGLVKKMVRLAMACEYQRRPIRRQDIGEKVLGSAGRQFKNVFAQAQMELRSVFGMQMVELPAKEKATVAQRRAAQQKSDKPKSQPAAWVLTSVLPMQYHTSSIIQPTAVPTSEEDSKYTAIYTLLVSLISLSGGSLTEMKIERYLRRVQMEDQTPIEGSEKTERLFKRMERDGYLVKVKETIGGGGEEEVSWIVGPRAKVEVGDAGVRALAKAVHGDLDGQAQEELSRKIARSLGVGERPEEVEKDRQARAGSEERPKRGRPRKEEDDAEEEPDESEEDE